MESFRNVVNFCNFLDLGYVGTDFTWCNMQEAENRIQFRIDRALANTEWIGKFEGARVYHLVDSTSDHCALFLTNSPSQYASNVKRFHFEALWSKMRSAETSSNHPGGWGWT